MTTYDIIFRGSHTGEGIGVARQACEFGQRSM